MLWMAVVLAGAQVAAPSAAAVALGDRLARTGTLAALLPMMVAKETDELVAAHPELSAAEQAELRRVAKATADMGSAKLFAAEGRQYAELLTEAELRTLVAQAESPEARRLRAAQPHVIAGVMAAMGGMDFKKDALAAFCARTGKGCPAK